MDSITELPEKWCVKNKNCCLDGKIKNLGYKGNLSGNAENDYYFVDAKGYIDFEYIIPEGYTEISYAQFERFILNKQLNIEWLWNL